MKLIALWMHIWSLIIIQCFHPVHGDKLYADYILRNKHVTGERSGWTLPHCTASASHLYPFFFCTVSHTPPNTELVYDETANQIRREAACRTVIEINLFVESAVWECLFEWCAICHRNKDTELESKNRKQIFTRLRRYAAASYARGGAEGTAHNQNLTALLFCAWTCLYLSMCGCF